MTSNLIKPFINDINEPNLYQVPVSLKTKKGDVVQLDAVFLDTKPEGSEKGTVITIHGAPGSHKDFKYVTPQLEAENIRVIGVNFPGCGYTSYDEKLENNNFERVQFVQGILDALKLPEKSVIFVGHSRGSENALKMSADNIDKTVGLISVNPIGLRRHRGCPRFLLHIIVFFWRFLLFRNFMNWFLVHLYTKFLKIKVSDGHACGVAVSMMVGLDYSDAIPFIEKFNNSDLQGLFLYGGRDWMIETEVSQEFLENFKDKCEITCTTKDNDPETVQKVMTEISNGRKTIEVHCLKNGHFLQKDQCDLISQTVVAMFQRKSQKLK